MRSSQPLDEGAVKRPAGPLCDPTVPWRGGLDEEITEERGCEVGAVNRQVEVPWFDIDASCCECAAAVHPPLETASIHPVEELLKCSLPPYGPEGRALEQHLLEVRIEVRKDPLEVGRIGNAASEGLAGDP